MSDSNQGPWSESQWGEISKMIIEQGEKSTVAGMFLPCFGPLADSAEVVRREELLNPVTPENDSDRIRVDDVKVLDLWTLSVKIQLKQQQVSVDDLNSAKMAFRRAATLVARAEDTLTFSGPDPDGESWPKGVELCGGANQENDDGLWGYAHKNPIRGLPHHVGDEPSAFVGAISAAVSHLESRGYLGPFGCVMGQRAFDLAHTPQKNSMVMPSDRMEPLLGRALLRSSTLKPNHILVVSLDGNPVELVVAKPLTAQYIRMTDNGKHIFRVYERYTPRVRMPEAITGFALAES